MHDISERKKIELSLQQTNQTLEALLSDQLNETKEANTKLRELSQKMQATREDERLRISRELHDDLGQLLTSAKIYLGFIGEELNIQDEGLKKNFESVVNTLDQSIASIRNIAFELRPIVLKDIGLFEAIQAHCKRIEKETAIPVEVIVNIEYLHIEKDAALHLFRIFQESVNNVIKHANASKITVTIDKEDNQLILQVVDNGQGFDINMVKNNSLGLKTMKERAHLINGQYFIQSNPGKGTAVKVSVPLDQLL
jgi:signal transduction histidine kinase